VDTTVLDVDTARDPIVDLTPDVRAFCASLVDLNRDNPRRQVRLSFVAG
jgi:hypothetical protein